MNNDRLLTRVWDEKEKKMIYCTNSYSAIGDEIRTNELVPTFFIGLNNCGVLKLGCSMFGVSDPESGTEEGCLYLNSFREGYIPMQCTGRKDKNNKLIYQKDIAKAFDEKEQQDVIIEIDYYDFEYQWVGVYQDDYNNLLIFKDFELLGNRYEHPELKEKITKYQDIYKGLK